MRSNTYLMSVERYFGGEDYFKVTAHCKAEALLIADDILEHDPKYAGGNHKKQTLKGVKKVQA